MRGFSFGFASAFGLSSGSTAALSAAATLLAAETNGLALDFTDDEFQPTSGFYGSARIKDASTPANEYDSSPTKAASSLLTYTSPSPKLCLGPAGTYRYQAHNLVTYSNDFTNAAWTKSGTSVSGSTISGFAGGFQLVQQNLSGKIIASATYTFSVTLSGTGTIHLDGNGLSGSTAVTLTATPTVYSYSFTAPSSLGGSEAVRIISHPGDTATSVVATKAHLRRTPSDSTYLATTSAARYDLPYEWNTSSVLQGILVEEARTNLFLSNRAAATQTITVANGSVYTVSFFGTGSITFSGATSSTLNGTGASDRVSTTFTTGSTSLTCTVSGTIDLVQVELGSTATSPIETFGSTVTRAADSGLGIATSAYPHSATNNAAMIYYVPKDVATAMVALRWDDNTSNEVVSIGHSASAVPGLTVTDGGAAQTAPLTSGTVSANTAKKLAVSWKANAFLLSNGGATAVSDTSGTLPTVTTLDIGPTLTGYIKQIVVLPVEKTSGQVEALAT